MESALSRKPVSRPLLLALAVVLLSGCMALGPAVGRTGAASLVLYKNPLDTAGKRSQVKQYGSKTRCNKGGSKKSFRFSLGKKAKECFYRLPVVGQSTEVSGTGVLLKSTPAKLRGRTWLAVSTRQASNGSRYQLAVFPSQKKVQLRKVSSAGKIKYLAVRKKVGKVSGPGRNNRIALRAFASGSGSSPSATRLVAWVNGVRIAVVVDTDAVQPSGRLSTFSVGSGGVAYRATGSFKNVAVRIPDPLG